MFREAVRGARAIARVTITEGADPYPADPTASETYRVERVLKGKLPGAVTLAPAWTTLCHDTVGFYAEEAVGNSIVIAIDMPYYDQVIHPVWSTFAGQGVSGSAGVPPGVTTLDELEAAILAEIALPDTSTEETRTGTTYPLAFILAAAMAAVAAFVATVRRSGGSKEAEEGWHRAESGRGAR